MRRTLLVALTVLSAVVAGPATASGAGRARTGAKTGTTITLVTHDSFVASKSVLAAFTRQTGITVKVLRAGDTGTALDQAILSKSHPLGDVFFGVDNTFLGRALDAGIFERYEPAALTYVPNAFRLDPSGRLTPIDHGDVCVDYDVAWFAHHDLPVPSTLDDLVEPQYKGLLVVEDPAVSSPGLAFTLATIARYGERGWQAYWAKLRANGVKVDSGWKAAYDGDFTQGAGKGAYPMVVSYGSSPVAAVYGSKPRPKTSPVGAMLRTCFRQVEFAGVLQGTAHKAAARKLVDFLLSTTFQADVPLRMFVWPVRDGTLVPVVFTKFAKVPTQPWTLPAATVAANRDRWIAAWHDTVLR